MSAGHLPQLLVLSSRPDILAAVVEAAGQLEPRPEVHGLFGRTPTIDSTDLIIVDIAEPLATIPALRRRFGEGPALIALIEGTWVDRLGSALAGDWADYLFYPLNLDELGLVWRRHTAAGEAPELHLDVDESGRIAAVIPSDVSYQRPVVERLVLACRHLADLDDETAFRLRVALGEAVANAILYGGRGRPGAVVRIVATADRDGVRLEVTDEGEGFDPTGVPDPTAQDGVGRSRGRGLFLLKRLADEVRFNERGNQVSLTFRHAMSPLKRVEPWLGRFAEVTGLRFRVERLVDGAPEVLFDAWGASGAPGAGGETRETWSLGAGGTLRLAYEAESEVGGGGDPAAGLLAGLLGVVAEREESHGRSLERHLRRERVLAELEIARDLQLRLMPDPRAFRDLARVAARCDPALSLGGDFYYLARLSGRRLAVLLGDVSSHGPSAALIMALTLSAAAAVTAAEREPAPALHDVHGQLLAALESTEMYMTLFYGVFDLERRELRYANAGHPYAYRLGEGGVDRLAALDPPLGMAPAPRYGEERAAWAGDTFLAFSDGLAELRDPIEDPGSDVRALIDGGEREPSVLVEALFAGTDDEMRLDDRTAVAVRP